MGWLANKLGSHALEIQRREMLAFIENLTALDSDEIGMVVACANHQRLLLLNAKGWDLRYPATLTDHPSNIPLTLAGAIKNLQREGKQPLAAGLMVWLHTIRAMQWLELRQSGRDLWEQLQRGFPYAESSAATFTRLTGYEFDTDGADQVPDGLSPSPK